jgi:GTP pyrophosphokinase
MVPLNYKLQNAQRVEIMARSRAVRRATGSRRSSATSHPRAGSRRCASGSATRISRRTWARGARPIDKELQRLGATGASHEKIAAALGYPKIEEFLAALGEAR